MSLLKRNEDQTLKGLDLGVVLGTFITFLLSRAETKGVTQVWYVCPRQGNHYEAPIGTVKWFGRWRKYGYFPAPATVYEEVCNREIAEVLEELTKIQRADAAVRRLAKGKA